MEEPIKTPKQYADRGWVFSKGRGIPYPQLNIHLPNGYIVTVTRGPGTYGWEEGLFECAAWNPQGDMVMLPTGWLDPLECMEYAEIVFQVSSNKVQE